MSFAGGRRTPPIRKPLAAMEPGRGLLPIGLPIEGPDWAKCEAGSPMLAAKRGAPPNATCRCPCCSSDGKATAAVPMRQLVSLLGSRSEVSKCQRSNRSTKKSRRIFRRWAAQQQKGLHLALPMQHMRLCHARFDPWCWQNHQQAAVVPRFTT